jgi:hypothetical protein
MTGVLHQDMQLLGGQQDLSNKKGGLMREAEQ